MRVWFLALVIGCEMSAATSKGGQRDSGTVGMDGDEDSPGSGGSDDTDESGGADLDEVDADEDGYTPDGGDCDDDDDTVYPGAVDDCDEVDSDCDGDVDEDSAVDDVYEPNDASPYDLGTLDGDDSVTVYAFLQTPGDEDRFTFDFTDGLLDFFTLRVTLHPQTSDAYFQMRVEHLDTGDVDIVETDGSSSVEFEEGDTLLSADGGQYQITVTSNGTATCVDEYRLKVELDALF